jgi:hypothetical protein
MEQSPWNRQKVRWPPQTEWLPIYSQRSHYNEDEIVALIVEIYNLYILFGYLLASQVDWAPEGGHPFNEALCNELGIAASVVSLMKRLPYAKEWMYGHSSMEFHMFPVSPTYRYLNDEHLHAGRNANMFGQDKQILPRDIALTDTMTYGTSIILDTEESK